MARFAVLRIVPLALIVLLATAGPVQASVITTGDVDPGGAATQPDPWEVGGILKVGNSGNGTLNVAESSVVSIPIRGSTRFKPRSTGEATGAGST